VIRWVFAFLHLLALGIGLGAVHTRARALGEATEDGYRRALYADSWWGVAALLWIVTGLHRALGPFEKGWAWYSHNPLFLAKMSTLAVILALEAWPMVTFIRWRVAGGRGLAIDRTHARTFARISHVQSALVIVMVLLATAMARGMFVE
jgi:putative membrane protein